MLIDTPTSSCRAALGGLFVVLALRLAAADPGAPGECPSDLGPWVSAHVRSSQGLPAVDAVATLDFASAEWRVPTAELRDQWRLTRAGRPVLLFYAPDGLVVAVGTERVACARLDAAAAGLAVARLRSSLHGPVAGDVAARMPWPVGRERAWQNSEDGEPFADVVGDLTAALLPGPVREVVAGADHLVVVPSGIMAVMPHVALEAVGPRRALIETSSVVVATGLFDALDAESSAWRTPEAWMQRRGREAGPGDVLVAGDPGARAADASAGRIVRLGGQESFDVPHLPGAVAEAEAVALVHGVAPLVGPAATVSVLRERARSARWVHLAAHAVDIPQRPLDASRVLLCDRAGRLAPWTARHVQATPLLAEAVVLTGSQSGLGRVHDGGLLGLPRAFRLAGARHVIMSLWRSDDESAIHFLEQLHGRLRVPAASVPEAARRAALATRERFPHPRSWASFAVHGGSGLEPPVELVVVARWKAPGAAVNGPLCSVSELPDGAEITYGLRGTPARLTALAEADDGAWEVLHAEGSLSRSEIQRRWPRGRFLSFVYREDPSGGSRRLLFLARVEPLPWRAGDLIPAAHVGAALGGALPVELEADAVSVQGWGAVGVTHVAR